LKAGVHRDGRASVCFLQQTHRMEVQLLDCVRVHWGHTFYYIYARERSGSS